MKRIVCLLAAILVLAGLSIAQENRATIQGAVKDPQGGLIAGATVVVTNINTNVPVTLKTNVTGRYSAPLLMPGNYTITAAATGFKKEVHQGIDLLSGEVRDVDLTLQIGAATESVTVTTEAPIVDATHTDNGAVLDDRTVRDIPVMTNVVTSMIQFVPGVNGGFSASQLLGPHSTIGGSDYNNGSGVGGNVWTIDGAFSNGNARYTSNLPSNSLVSEVKVLENTFDGSFGHSLGLGITITTKSGTNDFHGDASENYWSQRWQGSNLFTKQQYYQKIAAANATGNTALANSLASQPIQPSGHSHLYGFTATGPMYIPHLFSLKNKVFWTLSYTGEHDAKPETANTYPHVVPSAAEKTGNFSDLLKVTSDGLAYQLYDPFSVKVDTTRSGTHYVRQPLAGNVLPPSYIAMGAPIYKNYTKYWPDPNNWFDQTQAQNAGCPNFGAGNCNSADFMAITTPYNWLFGQWSGRMDMNLTDKLRVFGRYTRNHFVEYRSDWTYFIVQGFNNSYSGANTGVTRDDQNGVLDAVYTLTPSTILHGSSAVSNWVSMPTIYPYVFGFKPSDAGLPSYIDGQCGNWCYLPLMNVGGYSTNGISGTANPAYNRFYDYNGDVYHNWRDHQFRFGGNFRQQTRVQYAQNVDGTFGFGNNYFRQYEDAGPNGTYNPATLGLSWASFMMGMPTSATLSHNANYTVSNQFVAFFGQDTWRLSPKLTLTLSLRAEWENGPKGHQNDYIVGWNPTAQLPISSLAQAAYAANTASQVPELAASNFIVQGGALYAGTPGAPDRMWNSQLVWLPRVGLGYQLDSKTVVRGGYGIYYDTLDVNALGQSLNQTGYSISTNTTFTTNQGVNWGSNGACGAWCNLSATNLVSPLTDPFPQRPTSNNTQFNAPVGNAYGMMGLLALSNGPSGWNIPASEHPRMQRWRASIERQITNHDVVSFGYTGAFTSKVNVQISQSGINSPSGTQASGLPFSYFYYGNARPMNSSGATISCAAGVTNATANGCLEDTNFGNNVPNPFYINSTQMQALQASNPTLYAALGSVGSFFTSSTITKSTLLRPYPSSNYSTPNPIGHERETELDIAINHRFSHGLVGSFGYTYFDSRFANSYLQSWNPNDPVMPQALVWQPNNINPHRFTATWVYDLPFGKGRHWVMSSRILDMLVGGWTISGNYVWSEGTLIGMPNGFYYGDINSLKVSDQTLSHWFNTQGCVLNASQAGPGDTVVPLGQPCTSGWDKRTAAQPGTYQGRVTPLYMPVRNPNAGQLNGSLGRDFKFNIKDHPITFQFRGDVLNLENHSFMGAVNNGPTSGLTTFGAITSGSTVLNRFIQIQGHIRW